MDEEKLKQDLVADLTTELGGEETFNSSALTQKIINAIREVKQARKYPIYYTDEQKNADLYEFYSNIRNIALYDYNMIGAEFEESHSENSVSRSWVDRKSLFIGIIPLCKF